MTLKGQWPVEEPMLEQWVGNEEQQKEMNHHALTPISLLKGLSIVCGEVPGNSKSGKRGVQRGAQGCFSKCLFVRFYFSIPESIIQSLC